MSKDKVMKFGYRLTINTTGEPGGQNWRKVGFLFRSSEEAMEFKKVNHPDIKKYSISAVRLNVEPVGVFHKDQK